jgi:hypothetical protein
MCTYESVKNRLPLVEALSIEPIGLTPVNGENPEGVREVGIYNPQELRGKMAVYFALNPEMSKAIMKNKEICKKVALEDRLILSEGGKLQKPKFLGIKKHVATISNPQSKGDITFLIYDKSGAEYLENVLESLSKR